MTLNSGEIETDVFQTKASVSELFDPVRLVIEDLNVAGWSVVVNYSLRGYEHFETTYPDAWVTEYVNKHYHVTDPALVWALAKQGMRRWSETGLPDLFGVFRKAGRHGLKHGGIWSQKTGNKRTVLFAAKTDREFHDEEMERVQDVVNPFFYGVGPDRTLSIGEKEVLKSLVTGASLAEIAVDLKISDSAVKARLASSRSKLNCKTNPQLIYMIVNEGLLH